MERFDQLRAPQRAREALQRVARRNISLREIRESDGARIRHRRVAEGTDEEVPYEKIQKAFEITSGNYVPISKDEMAAMAPKKSRAIEVQDFVDLGEIDPIYFDSPYYLGPADGAEKAYSLLASAMEASGKVAISRFVFRNKEHLAALRTENGVLTLTTMRFADEVVPASELDDVLPGGEAEGGEEGGRDGGEADRVADQRLRPDRLPRRVPRGTDGADRTQGGRQGDRRLRPSPSRRRPRRRT